VCAGAYDVLKSGKVDETLEKAAVKFFYEKLVVLQKLEPPAQYPTPLILFSAPNETLEEDLYNFMKSYNIRKYAPCCSKAGKYTVL
jgi:hypothetical protein